MLFGQHFQNTFESQRFLFGFLGPAFTQRPHLRQFRFGDGAGDQRSLFKAQFLFGRYIGNAGYLKSIIMLKGDECSLGLWPSKVQAQVNGRASVQSGQWESISPSGCPL